MRVHSSKQIVDNWQGNSMNKKSTSEMEYVTCALCNLDDAEPFFEDRGFQLVRCRRCGLVYINPRPTLKESDEMCNMSVDADAEIMDHFGYESYAYLHELKARKFLKILSSFVKRGKILDIGCAAGFFLNQARCQGFDVQGVELSKEFCTYARDRFKLYVFQGTLRENRFPDEHFDVVTMFDVLSHLRAPVEDLNEINRILKRDGLLFIETGNKGELDAKAVEKFGAVWGSPAHQYHYGTETLVKLLETTQFECLSIDRFSLIFSSIMEVLIRKILTSGKRKSTSYHRLQLDNTPKRVKGILMIVGAHLYFFAKYALGKLLRESNMDSTVLVFCRKKNQRNSSMTGF